MEKQEWQKGNDSKMTSLQRLELHILWLEQLHAEMKQAILEKKINEIEVNPLQGFPKDNDKL
jgi:hypothetical protein